MTLYSKYLLVFSTLTFSLTSLAASDMVGEKSISLQNGRGQALVSSRIVEEKLGRPYSVELKVSCGPKVPHWQSLPILDSESVCDVKPQSAKLSADGKYISVMIRETDADSFNKLSQMADARQLGEMKPKCQKAGKEFRFSVEQYCQK
ncbi:hypothetical protein [Bdellovibrio sp. ArHS]|uniref:hypothetical protein n=1 Tax=Bdellovibrio sp. ArHS TaxID=1569284 RepID=UPI0025C65CD1|nr:hypothetical protein [Bdellovibrio sp. ArHS]